VIDSESSLSISLFTFCPVSARDRKILSPTQQPPRPGLLNATFRAAINRPRASIENESESESESESEGESESENFD
jgi:hypothetical protein